MRYRGNTEYQNLSEAIAWMRFPLILMIVLLHCYCAIDATGHSSYFVWVYPFGLCLGETGVPAFFFVSGFLFYFSQKSYAQKVQSRIRTLLIPYLFWNTMVLLVYGLLELSGHGMLIAGKGITDYGVFDYIRAFIDRGQWDRGNGVPMLCPYWYIRNLMLLCVLSPMIYYAVKYLKLVFVFILFGWWVTVPYNGMIISSLLFFSLGSYFSINGVNPILRARNSQRIFLIIWAGLFIFDWLVHSVDWDFTYGLYVHRIAIITNIFALLFVGSCFGKQNLAWKELLNKSAFWIYTVHYPLTLVVGGISSHYLRDTSDWLLGLYYVVSVFVVTASCLVSYVVFRKWFPGFISFSTGSRA